MTEKKFKVGDKVQMNTQTSASFKTIPLQSWTVKKVRDNGIITVERPRKKGGVTHDTWHQDLLELVESKPAIFSVDQEVAIKEMIAERIRVHEESNFHE